MKYYNFEYEKIEQLLHGLKIKEEVHGDKKFLMKQVVKYTTDANISSNNELIHRKYYDYYEVCNYMPLQDNVEQLDLTWMNEKDIFNFKSHMSHISNINEIIVNINNLYDSHISGIESANIIVKKGSCSANLSEQLKIFKNFLNDEQNLKSINSIKFEGFNINEEFAMVKYTNKQLKKFAIKNKNKTKKLTYKNKR